MYTSMHVTPFVFVLHVSLALFVTVFVCACLHMNSICIILYTCKQIRLYMLHWCCCYALYGCHLFVCWRVFAHGQHMHYIIYIVCVVVEFVARVCTCATHAWFHTHVHVYVHTVCHYVIVLHVCLPFFVARVCTCTTDALSHTHVNVYVYACCLLRLCCMCCLLAFCLRVCAHVQPMH